jgi:hypothetical protein
MLICFIFVCLFVFAQSLKRKTIYTTFKRLINKQDFFIKTAKLLLHKTLRSYFDYTSDFASESSFTLQSVGILCQLIMMNKKSLSTPSLDHMF